MRWLVLFAVVGCGDSNAIVDAAPPPFTLHIDFSWGTTDSPDVTSVTIDGAAFPSGSTYTVDETYESYADAVGSFAPRSVVVMTGSGSVNGLLQMHTCGLVGQDQLKTLGRLTGESDEYGLWSPPGTQSYGPSWGEGTCTGVDGEVGAATRRARTR